MLKVYSKVIQLYVYIFFLRFFSRIGYSNYWVQYSSLCYTVGPCCLSIWYIVVCICYSQIPNLSLRPTFPLWCLFSVSQLFFFLLVLLPLPSLFHSPSSSSFFFRISGGMNLWRFLPWVVCFLRGTWEQVPFLICFSEATSNFLCLLYQAIFVKIPERKWRK